VRWETCAVRGLSAINGATCRMFPWCGTAGLSVSREADGFNRGEEEEELEVQEPDRLSDKFGSLVCMIFSEIRITKSLSAALGQHGLRRL